jgi:cytochrome c1
VLFAVTTTNKLALLGALIVYVGFALTVSMLVPRLRPGFPGQNGVRLFVLVSAALFAGMIGAVVAFAREKPGPPRPATTAQAAASVPAAAATTATGATAPTATAGSGGGDAVRGRQLASSLGCGSCHSIDGSPGAGPTWKGLAGSQVTLSDGSTVTADTSYLLRAIRNPDAQIVKGYGPGIMSGVVRPGSVSVQDARDLVAYIRQFAGG